MRQALSTLWSSDLFLCDAPDKGASLGLMIEAENSLRRWNVPHPRLAETCASPSVFKDSGNGQADLPPGPETVRLSSSVYDPWRKLATENSWNKETIGLAAVVRPSERGFRAVAPQNRLKAGLS